MAQELHGQGVVPLLGQIGQALAQEQWRVGGCAAGSGGTDRRVLGLGKHLHPHGCVPEEVFLGVYVVAPVGVVPANVKGRGGGGSRNAFRTELTPGDPDHPQNGGKIPATVLGIISPQSASMCSDCASQHRPLNLLCAAEHSTEFESGWDCGLQVVGRE